MIIFEMNKDENVNFEQKNLKYQTEWVEINTINPANYNPRGISQDAIDGLKQSIKNFGIPQPLIINKSTNTLVSGHQRLRASQELGLSHVPVIFVELSESHERALNVTLNNSKIEGFFTDDLGPLLAELKLDIGDDFFKDLRLDALEPIDIWESDINKIDAIDPLNESAPDCIKITCPKEIKDEVLIFIKAKFLETSFEGIHIE